jgi:hypothetical protein
MQKTKLNFVNRSSEDGTLPVLIFQKNVAGQFDETVIAWLVIENCGKLDNYAFVYSSNFAINASDSYGNFTPQLTAYEGQAYDMVVTTSGDMLQLSSIPAAVPTEVEIRNKLPQGAINANCYREGKFLATKTGLAPEQHAAFEFQPSIYIGVVAQMEEGEVIDPAIVSQINSEINLFGITSADIVMTGGGSKSFQFTLENINK